MSAATCNFDFSGFASCNRKILIKSVKIAQPQKKPQPHRLMDCNSPLSSLMHFFTLESIPSNPSQDAVNRLAAREFFSFSLKIQIELDRRRKFFQSEIMSRDER
jgi:hypothetical protein